MNSNLTPFGYIQRSKEFFEKSEKIIQSFKTRANIEIAMEEEE